jgi:putative oxidoreductase
VFQKLLETSNDLTLTFVRLLLGIVFFAHGAQKLLGWYGGFGFSASVGAFLKMGMPLAIAYFAIFVEFFGGLSMIFGLLSRLSGLAIAAEMCGAVCTVHYHNGFFMNWYGLQKGEGFEYHLLAISIAVLIMIRGAGALSLDRMIAGKT